MSYQISFTPEAEKVLTKYKKSNPNAFKKFLKLIPELAEHPKTVNGLTKLLNIFNKIFMMNSIRIMIIYFKNFILKQSII